MTNWEDDITEGSGEKEFGPYNESEFFANHHRFHMKGWPPDREGKVTYDSAAHLQQAAEPDSPHRTWWRRLSDTGWLRGLFRLNEPWVPRRDNWLQKIARRCLPDEKTKQRRSL